MQNDRELHEPLTPFPSEKAQPETKVEPEICPDTEALLKQTQMRVAELEDAWLRAKAETDNMRKRAQMDIANAHKYAIENFAQELLPVKDSLETSLTVQNANLENLRNGVELTLKQLITLFEKLNLKEINPVGEKFDPHKHQAISMVPSEGEPNRVVTVLQKGYSLYDRVIRPALVTVSKASEG